MVKSAPESAGQKSLQRVEVAIDGRYMLEDRSEHSCHVVAMSPDDMTVKAERLGEPGEKVIAYLSHVGRVEGIVTQRFDDGFLVRLLASERKRERLAAQLTWLADQPPARQSDHRRHVRVEPRNPASTIRFPDGQEHACRVVDLSVSGAAVEVDVKPAIGLDVVLGTMHGRVVRHFDGGVAIEFATIQPQDVLET